MSDDEVERMTLCVAQMAATLRAADRIAGHEPKVLIQELPAYYASSARHLYEAARDNVAGPWPVVQSSGQHHNGDEK